MKFSEVARGTRSDEAIQLPRFNGQADESPAIVARVRALNGIEEELALSVARRRAEAQGIKEPTRGEPIFDFALMVETVAIAIVDPDSDPKSRKPFFDGGGDQIREWFGLEAVTLLYELQQDYQSRVSPTVYKLDGLEYLNGMMILGGEDEERARRFFYQSKPGLRWSYTRSMALLQVSSLTPKSESGSSSEKPSPKTRKRPKK